MCLDFGDSNQIQLKLYQQNRATAYETVGGADIECTFDHHMVILWEKMQKNVMF